MVDEAKDRIDVRQGDITKLEADAIDDGPMGNYWPSPPIERGLKRLSISWKK